PRRSRQASRGPSARRARSRRGPTSRTRATRRRAPRGRGSTPSPRSAPGARARAVARARSGSRACPRRPRGPLSRVRPPELTEEGRELLGRDLACRLAERDADAPERSPDRAADGPGFRRTGDRHGDDGPAAFREDEQDRVVRLGAAAASGRENEEGAALLLAQDAAPAPELRVPRAVERDRLGEERAADRCRKALEEVILRGEACHLAPPSLGHRREHREGVEMALMIRDERDAVSLRRRAAHLERELKPHE